MSTWLKTSPLEASLRPITPMMGGGRRMPVGRGATCESSDAAVSRRLGDQWCLCN